MRFRPLLVARYYALTQASIAMGLWDWLRQVKNENPKREYYLTGLVRVLHEAGVKQATVELEDLTETAGVNSPEDLAAAERLLDARARKKQA